MRRIGLAVDVMDILDGGGIVTQVGRVLAAVGTALSGRPNTFL